MDDLTRERFWPRPLPPPLPTGDGLEVILERRRVLLGDEDYGRAERDQQARLRAQANTRHRKLARAIRLFATPSRGAA